MRKRHKLKYTRPKAVFGFAEAAATLGSAAIQAAATYAAARQNAESIERQSEVQANALERQNDNNTRLQTQNVETQKETSNKIADSITANQMNLQMLAGNESAKDRAAESRIMVKRGGSVRRKLRNRGYNSYSLQGGYNMPFQVTDGGGAQYVSTTPEGYDLYELYGDNHEHYHKTSGGKYKSGVGIKFANGGIVEGEGNQNGRQGEYLLVTPDNGYFISKHNINGINPAGLINQGVNPIDAYNIQEAAKGNSRKYNDRLGLRTAGKYGTRVKYGSGGNMLYGDFKFSQLRKPNIAWNNVGKYAYNPNAISFMDGTAGLDAMDYDMLAEKYFNKDYANPKRFYTNNNIADRYTDISSLSRNASVSPEAVMSAGKPSISSNTLDLRDAPTWNYTIAVTPTDNNSANPPDDLALQDVSSKSNKYDWVLDAGVNAGAAGIQYLGNRLGTTKLQNAYNNAANLMTNAYNNLKTVDIDGLLDRNEFRSASYLPAIRSANYNVNPQLQDVNRSALRQQEAVRNNTLSSAARLNRAAGIEQAAQESRDKIYANQANQEEQIKQKNIEMINNAAAANVNARNTLTSSLASIRADLAKYNNDIANQRIMGAAQAQSQMGINTASAKANAYNASADAFSNAASNVANNAFKAWQTEYTTKQNYLNSLVGADAEGIINSLAMNVGNNLAGKDDVLKAHNGFITNKNYIAARRLKNLFPEFFTDDKTTT